MSAIEIDEDGNCKHGIPPESCGVCKHGPTRPAKPQGSHVMWLEQLEFEMRGHVERFHGYMLNHPERWTVKSAGSYRTYVSEGLVRLDRGEQFDSFSGHVQSGLRAFREWVDRNQN